MFYQPVHFELREFIHPQILSIYGDKSIWFMDSRILQTMDGIRDLFNRKVYINRDHLTGRGLRPFGNGMSQHYLGKAIDFDVDGYPAKTVRHEIINNPNEEVFKYITGIELDVSWVHIDCRNHNGLLQFKQG